MSVRTLLAPALLALLCGCGRGAVARATVNEGQTSPAAVEALVAGAEAARSGRHAQAEQRFDAAVRADPRLWEGRYDLGLELARRGELASAEAQLVEAAKLAPNAEDVVVALAEVRLRRGEPKPAADALAAFVKAHAEAQVARLTLVRALRAAGRLDQAVEAARAALARRPRDPEALAELALAHLEKGQTDSAELLVKEALAAGGTATGGAAVGGSAAAERTAGLVALKRGDDALAFQHFNRASALSPTDTTARLNVANVLLQAGVPDRAETEYRAILAIAPDDLVAMRGLAAALRLRGPGGNAEAERLLLAVLAKRPDDLAAAHNLGLLYVDAMSRPKDGKRWLQLFLRNAAKAHPARPLIEKKLSAIR